MVERVITKQLAGVEDLLLGTGNVTQARGSGNKTINKINASHIPLVDTAGNFTTDFVEDALVEVIALIVANTAAINANSASIQTLESLDVKNSSFEIADSITPTHPESWIVTEFTGGTVALDSATVNNGTKSVKCSSTGTGGGKLETSKLYCTPGNKYRFQWSMISSVVDVLNDVEIDWYKADGTLISTTSLYSNATTNPTTWTLEDEYATAPALATQFVFRLIGCNSTDVTVGSTYFDGVEISRVFQVDTGANITSAGTLLVNIRGNYHHVTGTVTITALEAVAVGTVKVLEFDASLIFTHHATNLICPRGEDITTRAGDIITLVEYATGQWKVLSYYPFEGLLSKTHDHGFNSIVNTWQASTAVSAGDFVIPTTTLGNEMYFKCTTAGTTAAGEPTWPTKIGGTVTDGTAVWTAFDGRGSELNWRSLGPYTVGFYTVDGLSVNGSSAALGDGANYLDLGVSLTATRNGSANIKLGIVGDAANATDSGNDTSIYIYINGVQTGTQRITTRNSTTYVYFNETFALNVGDVITVKGNDSGGTGTNYVTIKLRVQCTEDTASIAKVSGNYDAS